MSHRIVPALASRADSNVSNPSTWPNYENLRGCVKWCFSACHENGTPEQISENCGRWKPANADQNFEALDIRLGCRTAACLCGPNSESFNNHINYIVNCTVDACRDGPCQSERPGVVDVFANYCKQQNFVYQFFQISSNDTVPLSSTCTTTIITPTSSTTSSATGPTSTVLLGSQSRGLSRDTIITLIVLRRASWNICPTPHSFARRVDVLPPASPDSKPISFR